MLEARDIEVAFDGKVVLSVEHLAIRPHETLTLIGHNGSGKSTLIKVLGLLLRPQRGELRLDGELVDYAPKRVLALRRRMAGVLQNPLLCRMSVFNNVALGLRFRRMPSAEIEQRVRPWLERLKIAHLADRRAAGLSGGEAQRASLARAFALEPDVMFLDEPFSALDAPTRQSLLLEFQEILAEARTTTVFATHDRSEALALGDRVAVMIDGKLVQIGQADDVFSRPATEDVARFVGVETLIPGRVDSCDDGIVGVRAGDARLEVLGDCPVGERVVVCVRPEEITLVDGTPVATQSARNVLSGTVAKIVPVDAQYRVVVDCGVTVVSLVTRPAFRELALEVGRPVTVTFKAAAAHLTRRPGVSQS